MKMNQHIDPDKISNNSHPSQLLTFEVPTLSQINHNHINNTNCSISHLYHRNNLSTTTTATINYDALIFALADRFIENNGNLNINLNTSVNLNNNNNNKNYVNNGNGPSVMYNYGPQHSSTRINFIPTNNGNILSNLPFIITQDTLLIDLFIYNHHIHIVFVFLIVSKYYQFVIVLVIHPLPLSYFMLPDN